MPLVAGILLLVPQTTTAFGVELVVLAGRRQGRRLRRVGGVMCR
jgi:hypothetical protein